MYQFAHVEGYARSSAKKVKVDPQTGKPTSKPKCNVAEIIGEVLRDQGHCDHVENPQKPTFHFGDEATMRAIPERIERNCLEWKRQGNKAPRKDTQVLFTEVVSYERGVGTPEDYADWERRNIEEAKRKFGDRLVAILGHPEDEDHPHLHIYVLPHFGENPDVKTLHPGHVAVKKAEADAEARGEKLSPKLAGKIYSDRMREYQTDYYERVAIFCGMTRNGPGGRRLTNAAKKKEKDQARAIKDALELVERRQRELDDLKGNLDSEIEKRAALRAKELARVALVKQVNEQQPDLPAAPTQWEPWKFKDYTDKLLRIIKLQASKIAALPAMQETIALIRSEGQRVKTENEDLLKQVAQLQEQAKAWAIVQQIAPDVAKEVVRRLKPKTPAGQTPEMGQASVANVPSHDVPSLN